MAVCSAVVNNGLDSDFSLLTKYWKTTTGCSQHKLQTGCHKTSFTFSLKTVFCVLAAFVAWPLCLEKCYPAISGWFYGVML